MGTHNSKHDAYTDQRHQGDSDYSKSALKVRNLLGRGQHPRRPQHPGSEAEQTDSNDEENCFAGDTDTPGSGWLSFSRQEKEAKARKSNYAASAQDLPSRPCCQSCNELLELMGATEELLRSWMKNDQAVKHGTKPGGAREDVHSNQNPPDELHFVPCRAAY